MLLFIKKNEHWFEFVIVKNNFFNLYVALFSFVEDYIGKLHRS